jgi:purine-binding chemotaxis protein CheW
MTQAAQSASAARAVMDQRRDQRQYLTFVLGSETLAIGILTIREIIEYGEITDVPMMPPFIRGVLNLRGSVVPVVDLAARFGRRSSPVSRKTCIVIVEAMANGESQVMGVIVDAVNAVIDIAAEDIEPPPTFGASVRSDFIQGMGRVGGRFIIILDLDRVLSAETLATLAQVVDEQGVANPASTAA